MEQNNKNLSLFQEIEQLRKEVETIREINQRLLVIEEKREKEKVKEPHKKKPLEESLWWKKIVAYASIITSVSTLLHFILTIVNIIKYNKI